MIRIISEYDNSVEIAELRAEIVSKRNYGEVLFDIKQIKLDDPIKSSEELIAVIDLFISKLGYSPLGSSWKEINQQEAEKIIIFVMTNDLAYSAQLTNLQEAEVISAKLFNLFSGHCKFFTNALFVNNFSGISAWNSITEATFDTGVVIVSNSRIGILWVKDED